MHLLEYGRGDINYLLVVVRAPVNIFPNFIQLFKAFQYINHELLLFFKQQKWQFSVSKELTQREAVHSWIEMRVLISVMKDQIIFFGVDIFEFSVNREHIWS